MTDLLVDGSSLFARAFFATQADFHGRNRIHKAVQATLFSAVALLDGHGDRLGEYVDRVLFAWDGEDKHDLGYKKGERAEKPDGYYEARAESIEALYDITGCAHAKVDGVEADDIVATAVFHSTADTVYVASGDKDLQQLQGKNVHFYCLNKKQLLNSGWICSKWKVKRSNQMAIALAILGDKIDGIPGINGWGPVKLKNLFEAVTPEMSFAEALQAVEAQIPLKHLDGFYEDLGRTLLNPDIPGVPPPAPLDLADPKVVRSMDMIELWHYYGPVFRAYEGNQRKKTAFVD